MNFSAVVSIALQLALCLPGCTADETSVVQLDLQLPSDWDTLIDMDVLGAPTSSPYIGSVRFLYGNGASSTTMEFPWDARAGSLELGNEKFVTVQAVTAGHVIMTGHLDLGNVGNGPVTIPLAPSGGFSAAGTLLFPRQNTYTQIDYCKILLLK